MSSIRVFIKGRLREPSTYAGLVGITIGLGQLFEFEGAPAIAEGISNSAPAFVGGDVIGGGLALLGGIAAALLREKGGR